MGKIFPLILALVGLGAGAGAGLSLRPDPPKSDAILEADAKAATETSTTEPSGESSGSDFVKLNNQFVIPVVTEQEVKALVVLSLGLEVVPGGSGGFYQLEPKLRDAFLKVLFDHANSGGFDGVFTEGRRMENLRRALFEAARKVMGNRVKDVLVTDILRQDV